MISLGAVLLGIVNIAIAIAILVLIGLVIVWFMGYLGFPIPAQIQKGVHDHRGAYRALHDYRLAAGIAVALSRSRLNQRRRWNAR
jgi:hypothetical protein